MNRISGVYKIENTVTGDFYVGSSKNVEKRWKQHKCSSIWKRYPNSRMYQGMQKYGTDRFVFEILEEVEPGHLKEKEQQFIETLNPTYNSNNANGLDVERRKEYIKKYQQSEKGKKSSKKYYQSERGREVKKKYYKKRDNQLCFYNGKTLTLGALRHRFQRAGIPHPTLEAKKYLCKKD